MLLVVVGIVLVVHGLAHLLGLVPLLRSDLEPNWNLRSWALTGLIGGSASHWAGGALFFLSAILLSSGGLALLDLVVPSGWWRFLTDLGALASSVSIALYWNALPTRINKIGALGMNLLILGNWSQIWDWPI